MAARMALADLGIPDGGVRVRVHLQREPSATRFRYELLLDPALQRTVRPLRANAIPGPSPGGPAGGCGGRAGTTAMPGVLAGAAPKISVCMWARSSPRAVTAADISAMNPAGPHM